MRYAFLSTLPGGTKRYSKRKALVLLPFGAARKLLQQLFAENSKPHLDFSITQIGPRAPELSSSPACPKVVDRRPQARQSDISIASAEAIRVVPVESRGRAQLSPSAPAPEIQAEHARGSRRDKIKRETSSRPAGPVLQVFSR